MSEFQSYTGIKHIKAKPADERAVDYAALKKSIDALKRLGVVDKEKYGKINLTRYLYCNASTTASAVWVPLPTQEMRRALALMVAHATARLQRALLLGEAVVGFWRAVPSGEYLLGKPAVWVVSHP